MRNPIIIAAPSRTGSTMIAYLLYLHGVWIGRSRPTRKPGSNTAVGTENLDIMRIEKHAGKGELFKQLERIVPAEQMWLYKRGYRLLWHYKRWKQIFPEAKWVLPWRPPEDIQGSRKHTNIADKRADIKLIQEEQDKQRMIAKEVKYAHWVDSVKIAEKNVEEGKTLFRFCGLELNENYFNWWIQRGRWHKTEAHKPLAGSGEIHQEIWPEKGS